MQNFSRCRAGEEQAIQSRFARAIWYLLCSHTSCAGLSLCALAPRSPQSRSEQPHANSQSLALLFTTSKVGEVGQNQAFHPQSNNNPNKPSGCLDTDLWEPQDASCPTAPGPWRARRTLAAPRVAPSCCPGSKRRQGWWKRDGQKGKVTWEGTAPTLVLAEQLISGSRALVGPVSSSATQFWSPPRAAQKNFPKKSPSQSSSSVISASSSSSSSSSEPAASTQGSVAAAQVTAELGWGGGLRLPPRSCPSAWRTRSRVHAAPQRSPQPSPQPSAYSGAPRQVAGGTGDFAAREVPTRSKYPCCLLGSSPANKK